MIQIKNLNTLPKNCKRCMAYKYGDTDGPELCRLTFLIYNDTDKERDVLWNWSIEKYPCPLELVEEK